MAASHRPTGTNKSRKDQTFTSTARSFISHRLGVCVCVCHPPPPAVSPCVSDTHTHTRSVKTTVLLYCRHSGTVMLMSCSAAPSLPHCTATFFFTALFTASLCCRPLPVSVVNEILLLRTTQTNVPSWEQRKKR